MIALIQRVASASVTVRDGDTGPDAGAGAAGVTGRTTGEIGPGLLALVCAERGDTEAEADRLLAKLLGYRVFADAQGRMNLPVRDIDGQGTPGGLLIVSQFTLAADTNSGTRPSFTPAAAPEDGRRLYDHFVARARATHPSVQTGEFGAMMQVALVNDGPVTFWLRMPPDSTARRER